MSTGARLVVLTAAALALRLAIAPWASFWVDETFTIELLDGSAADVLDGVAETESTPPLYYALAWLWTQVTGLGELGLRSLSALAGAATVGLVAALGRLSGVRHGDLAAGALAAVSPFLVWFSTEARAYALATALATGALLVMFFALRGPDRRRLAAWAALGALSLLTHYATVFVLAPQAALLLWHARRGATAAAVGAVAATGLALVPLALAQRGNEHARELTEFSGPASERLVQLPKQFAAGYDAPLELAVAGVALVILAAGAIAALRGPAPVRRWAAVCLGVSGLAIAVPAVAALAGVADVLSSRYLLPALPPLLTVAAVGLAGAPWRSAARGLLVGLVALWAVVDVAVAADPLLQTRADWQGVARALGPPPAGGRAIVATPATGAFVLRGAYRPEAQAGPPRPVVEVAVTAAVSRGDDLPSPSPIPPATTPPAFAQAGFELVEERVESSWTLQRWRAARPVAVDPGLLAQASLDPTRRTAVLWEP